MKSVLIIEDDQELMAQLELALETRFEVLKASSVSAGVAVLQDKLPVAVLLDYRLPDGTALDFIKQTSHVKERSKILLMTAYAQTQMAIDCLNSGVSGFIEKPFLRETLVEFMNHHLGMDMVENHPRYALSYAKRTLQLKTTEYQLTEIEFNILKHFLNNEKKWISRNEIIGELWGASSQSRNTFDTHLTNLKTKVPSFREALTNLRGRGYLFETNKFQ